MKRINLKDVEAYIYSTIILPLKQLDVPTFSMTTPIIDTSGAVIEFYVSLEELTGTYRRNYQRNQARDKLHHLVYIKTGGNSSLMAEYENRYHTVKIFRQAFENIKIGTLLLGKIEDAFSSSYPFTKVKIVDYDRPKPSADTYTIHFNNTPF